MFGLLDPFPIVPGVVPVAIGAPHHDTRPGADADQGTGPVALALASAMNARAVVVSGLRRIVDVNKNPEVMGRHVRGYALAMTLGDIITITGDR